MVLGPQAFQQKYAELLEIATAEGYINQRVKIGAMESAEGQKLNITILKLENP